jgi:hypothetical protein
VTAALTLDSVPKPFCGKMRPFFDCGRLIGLADFRQQRGVRQMTEIVWVFLDSGNYCTLVSLFDLNLDICDSPIR